MTFLVQQCSINSLNEVVEHWRLSAIFLLTLSFGRKQETDFKCYCGNPSWLFHGSEYDRLTVGRSGEAGMALKEVLYL